MGVSETSIISRFHNRAATFIDPAPGSGSVTSSPSVTVHSRVDILSASSITITTVASPRARGEGATIAVQARSPELAKMRTMKDLKVSMSVDKATTSGPEVKALDDATRRFERRTGITKYKSNSEVAIRQLVDAEMQRTSADKEKKEKYIAENNNNSLKILEGELAAERVRIEAERAAEEARLANSKCKCVIL